MFKKYQHRLNNKWDINNNILQLFSLLMLTINNNLIFHNSSKFRVKFHLLQVLSLLDHLHTPCNSKPIDNNKLLVQFTLLKILINSHLIQFMKDQK